MPEEVPIADLRPSREVQEYEKFSTILDRILIRRMDTEKETDGFSIPDKYREPEAVGVIICAGDGVVLGNQWFPMEKFVRVGDIVRYGEHSAEKYETKDDPDLPDGDYFIVRVQDLRGVKRLKPRNFIDMTIEEKDA